MPPEQVPDEHAPGDDVEKEVSGDDWEGKVQDVGSLRPNVGPSSSDADTGHGPVQEMCESSIEEVAECCSTRVLEDGLLPVSRDSG